jgi:DNA-binding NarL/FixJ family response regulator
MNETPGGCVLVVEDEWIVGRDLQRSLIAAGYVVPDPATSASEALRRARTIQPDLATVDVSLGLGVADGVTLARELRRTSGTRVVFVSARSDIETLTRAAEVAPLGYVVKPFEDIQLRCAIHLAMRQLRAPADSGDVTEAVALRSGLERIVNVIEELGIATLRRGPADLTPSDSLRSLSPREWEVLRALLCNQRVPTIADALCLSQHTVRNHLKRIFRKLGVQSQSELIALFSRTDNAGGGSRIAAPPPTREGGSRRRPSNA